LNVPVKPSRSKTVPLVSAIPGVSFMVLWLSITPPISNSNDPENGPASSPKRLMVPLFWRLLIITNAPEKNPSAPFGIIDVNGGLGSNEGLLAIGPGGVLINECDGVINANGADGFFSGALVIISKLQNKGTINLFGDDAGPVSGSLLLEMDGVIDNHSTINEPPGLADTSGTVFDLDGLTGTFNDGLPDLCS